MSLEEDKKHESDSSVVNDVLRQIDPDKEIVSSTIAEVRDFGLANLFNLLHPSSSGSKVVTSLRRLTPGLATILRSSHTLEDNPYVRQALAHNEVQDIITRLEHLENLEISETLELTKSLKQLGFFNIYEEGMTEEEVRELFYALTYRFITVFLEFYENPNFVPRRSTPFTVYAQHETFKFRSLTSAQCRTFREYLFRVARDCNKGFSSPKVQALYASLTRE